MNDRLENLRMFFPAEVTGSYLAIQSLLKANGIGESEFMNQMVWVVIALTIANVVIYWKFYDVKSIVLHIVLGFGFIVWAANIDWPRFKDLPIIGQHVKLGAPILLIFYTLLTSFFSRPERKKEEKPSAPA
jgi:hypothetical protein